MQLAKLNGKVVQVPEPVVTVAESFFGMTDEEALKWLEWLLAKARIVRTVRRMRTGSFTFTTTERRGSHG